jgi:hypothetical protein
MDDRFVVGRTRVFDGIQPPFLVWKLNRLKRNPADAGPEQWVNPC